ncbi:MAG: RNA polymerase sigma factor [Patulibacter sp.]|nr:RNA polymerase sigma factor [Patulibacter sp.]
MTNPATRATIDAVWRIESAKLVAGLTRVVRDVGVAEELAQDAFVAALEQWPTSGVPDEPGAWLMTVAKRRGIDQLRRRTTLERKHEQLEHEIGTLERLEDPAFAAIAHPVEDDVLQLVFLTCHPSVPVDSRVALTLKLVGGLSTGEIARAFLTRESTVAQRIVRAKRTLAAIRAPFEFPDGDELQQRLGSVLDVVYLIFNEGYAASGGDDWIRPELCGDALRLARILAALRPSEPEVLGLQALLELQASRLHARSTPDGTPIRLEDQDRSRWDRLLITRGLAALDRLQRLGRPLGPYGLQAEIAACHARAASVTATNWPRIVALYDAQATVTGSPVVELNRAVAVAMAFGPDAGIELVDALVDDPRLAGYHLVDSVRGDLLERAGRAVDARAAFLRAAERCENGPERDLLLARANACVD